jgi:predicted nuclease with RNAse H fold
MKSVGIDLSASSKRGTGFSVLLEDLSCSTEILSSDKEIISRTVEEKPDIVCIDAPLFLPEGKRSFRKKGPPHLRACDKILLSMRIKFFPITLGPMRKLTLRGIRIKKRLESHGLVVYESFPGAVQDILGIPRKQRGLKLLDKAINSLGIRIKTAESKLDGDQLDAVTMSVVGMLYLWGHGKLIGKKEEGYMLIPDIST